ncbi:hypothetical protein FTUN_2241 [Frigoriglobus tundricola]|uniref:Uncharacterized protein n=1 Tax=Frigoriglobus tundricola TaxID=2774151 RepID=A0A6M5YKV3_9BACT|nr:hypothetical protein FTUN_2241 [Frigoriglobus tundricola]
MCGGPVQRRVRPPRRPRRLRTARATDAHPRSGSDTPRCVRPTATLSRGRGDARHLTPDPHPLCPGPRRGAAKPTRCAEVCAAAAFSVRAAGSATPSCSAPEATDAGGPRVFARGGAEELFPAEQIAHRPRTERSVLETTHVQRSGAAAGSACCRRPRRLRTARATVADRRSRATRPGACGPPLVSTGAAAAPATSPPTRIRCARARVAARRSGSDAPRCVRPPHSSTGPRGPQPPRAPRPRPPTRAGQGSSPGATRRSCPPPNEIAHRPRTPRWVRETTYVPRSGAAAGSASSPASAVPRRPRHRRAPRGGSDTPRCVRPTAGLHRGPRGRPPPHPRPASAVPAAPTRRRGADAPRRGVCGRRILCPGRGGRNPLVLRAPGHRRGRAKGLRSGRRRGAVPRRTMKLTGRAPRDTVRKQAMCRGPVQRRVRLLGR